MKRRPYHTDHRTGTDLNVGTGYDMEHFELSDERREMSLDEQLMLMGASREQQRHVRRRHRKPKP